MRDTEKNQSTVLLAMHSPPIPKTYASPVCPYPRNVGTDIKKMSGTQSMDSTFH